MPTALLSVSDKTGLIEELVKPLAELGWNFLASGGTAEAVRQAGIAVTEVATYTRSPEILGGRVKTLHPAVHGGILARESTADKADLEMIDADLIDLVAVNLYPFQATVENPNVTIEEAVENIDIGGVALIRAAAKNFKRVTVVVSPEDYSEVVDDIKTNESSNEEKRLSLAKKAFAHTSEYDDAIFTYLTVNSSKRLSLYPSQTLRYGENPHQTAQFFGYQPESGPLGGEQLHGKPVSYNNLLDLDSAWRAAISFKRPTVCIVKHLSPCGIASADSLAEAYPMALASDPVSAFGGVIATNQVFDFHVADQLGELFVECIIAPEFTVEALESLQSKSNLRLIKMTNTAVDLKPELRSVAGGVLQQSFDAGDPEGTCREVPTKREPTPDEMKALEFAWKACQHVKSNAIVFVQGEATVGIGGGQPNRIDCVHIAAQRAGELSKGAVMASDAFFPFPDAVHAAAEYGITAIIQPGGSIRDDASIQAADDLGIAMVFTGVRHFRH
ncbi:MAG: bifunctional phosphoribosylaminoimidazolecarboxamide formyltransferase/IMP cyclohydrolase [Chloroflexota bacterium]